MVRVILVDDAPELLEVLKWMYSLHPDVQVVGTARNNDEALELLKRIEVDIISIDIYMGKYNGFDLCRSVRKMMSHIFVTMCSSEGSGENKRIADSLGAHYFLKKPVQPQHIQELIDTYLRWLSTSA
ncbi:MAG: response regulator [Alicyclobacillus sp.]|nr:response regulator [Alicyclobacillus sp.]